MTIILKTPSARPPQSTKKTQVETGRTAFPSCRPQHAGCREAAREAQFLFFHFQEETKSGELTLTWGACSHQLILRTGKRKLCLRCLTGDNGTFSLVLRYSLVLGPANPASQPLDTLEQGFLGVLRLERVSCTCAWRICPVRTPGRRAGPAMPRSGLAKHIQEGSPSCGVFRGFCSSEAELQNSYMYCFPLRVLFFCQLHKIR